MATGRSLRRVTYVHPLSFLLGLEGIALLRANSGGGPDRKFVERRFAEVRALLGADLGEGGEVGRIGTVEGYRSWSQTYDEPGNPLIQVEEPIVRGRIDEAPPGRAIDAACGTGRHAEYLARRGHTVIGVDSSPDMLTRARSRVPGGTFLAGDVRRLPVPDGSADLVVCGLALTHLPELGPAIAEFARALAPGGRLVLSDIHHATLDLGGVARAEGPNGQVGFLPVSRFLASDYLAAALAAGFEARFCAEPFWPSGPWSGGPAAERWCPEAAEFAYSVTPAAIVWEFRRRR